MEGQRFSHLNHQFWWLFGSPLPPQVTLLRDLSVSGTAAKMPHKPLWLLEICQVL